ncbi:MAG: DUF4386 domain-containing protein [Chloroflexi bacterium]|nr:MAG: DUF4386 domain-containing protein [Chloroflexota bacterium]MBL1192728.1 DUF4386 domain-containing protein [Chloroflexota bacterium]NOH10020.1 DUF4386 domain-containing protein [Chloroflexota bacterium]
MNSVKSVEVGVTSPTPDIALGKGALVAGLGLLIMFFPAVFANFFVFEGLVVPEDAAATASNIMANQALFRLGNVSWLIVLICDVAVAWGLYVFLKPVNKSLSLLTAWLRLVYTTIHAAILFNLVIVLALLGDANYAAVLGADQLHALMMLFLEGRNLGFMIALVFFGFHLLILGYLVFKSGYVPKYLGILLIVGGLGWLFDSFGLMLLPNFDLTVSEFTFVGELLILFWLLIRGRKVEMAGIEAA